MHFLQNEIKMEDVCLNIDVLCGFDEISAIKSQNIDMFSLSSLGHFIADITSAMVFQSEFRLPQLIQYTSFPSLTLNPLQMSPLLKSCLNTHQMLSINQGYIVLQSLRKSIHRPRRPTISCNHKQSNSPTCFVLIHMQTKAPD